MRKMRNLLILAMITVLTACLFAGCASNAEKLEPLSGTWSITTAAVESEVVELLQSIEACEEEIALADQKSLYITQQVSFSTDGSYVFSYDAEAIRASVRKFYEGYFDALYEGRTTLNDVYETDFTEATVEEFRRFYAELYETVSFEELIDELTGGAFDYEALAQPQETGTVTVRGSRLYCTPEGQSKAEIIGFELKDGKLQLNFADAIQVYEKVK